MSKAVYLEVKPFTMRHGNVPGAEPSVAETKVTHMVVNIMSTDPAQFGFNSIKVSDDEWIAAMPDIMHEHRKQSASDSN